LRDSFTMVFAQNSSIFHWAVHQPIAFFQVWSHARRLKPLTEELWLPLRRHFFQSINQSINQSICSPNVGHTEYNNKPGRNVQANTHTQRTHIESGDCELHVPWGCHVSSRGDPLEQQKL